MLVIFLQSKTGKDFVEISWSIKQICSVSVEFALPTTRLNMSKIVLNCTHGT